MGIALVTFILTLAMPLLFFMSYDSKNQQDNTHVKATLTTASYDAVQTISLVDGYAFKSQAQKDNALNAFYMSLAAGYYSVLGVNDTKLVAYLPFVMLVDNDGIYVCYDTNYTSYWSDAAGKPEYADDTYYITPISAYAATYLESASSEPYVVQFTLGDKMTVYSGGRMLAEGSYTVVKDVLKNKYATALATLPFMQTESMYIEEKQAVITNTASRLINKYLNENVAGIDNVGFNLANTQYYFNLSTMQQSWQNALSGPTVVAFYHGPHNRLNNHQVAQVVLAGGELAKTQKYYLSYEHGDRYYHVPGCSHIDSSIYTNFNSMEEAAQAGAYPCPDCIY